MQSSAGSVSGWSVRWWAPRLSSRARQAAPIRRASGYGSSRSSASPSASRRRPAWRQSAARVSSPGSSRRAPLGRPGLAAAAGRRGLVAGGQRRAAAEHEALGERVGGEPVRAVQPGARRLADGVEAGHARAAVEVGRDAAHRVVGRRRDREQIARRVEARVGERARRCWGSARPPRSACRARRRARRCARAPCGSRARPRRAAPARRRSARPGRRRGARPRRAPPR